MALSREQFNELRRKGLTVEQITAFEAGQKPDTITAETQPKDVVKLWDTSGFTSGAKGIGKGLGKLALGVGTIGRGIQEGAGRLIGVDPKETSIFDTGSTKRAEANEKLEANNTGEKIASTITEIGAMAVPSGATYKTTQGLGFAARMLGRGSQGAISGTVQSGGEVGSGTAFGAAAETVLPGAVKVVARYGGDVLKGLAGLVSGKGSDVIEQVIQSPRAALQGGSGPSTQVLRETAGSIRGGVRAIRQKAGDAFEELTKNHTEPLNKKSFDTLVDDFITDVNETSFISTNKLDKIKGVVDTWSDYSPQGLNKLASKISKFYSGSDAARDTDAVVSGLNRRIRDWVGEQVPDIAEANSMYADKMDLIEQMDAIFKTKGSLDGRLGIQKTTEAIERLFNANKDIAREGVEEIEKELGIQILGKEAGRQLVDGVSRSQSAIGDFATGVSRAVLPPKLLLQVAARTGIAKEALESRLSTLEPLARSAAIELFTDLFGKENPENPEQGNTPKTLE